MDNQRDQKAQRWEQEDKLGADIIDECRVQLMMKFRFLDLALWRMDLEPMRIGSMYPIATNATAVFYDPPRIIARLQESFEEVVRDYLHMILHCIFQHPFDDKHKNREAWWLTCDIIVESTALEMCGNRFETPDDPARREALDQIKMQVGSLLPGKLYTFLDALTRTPEGQHFRGMSRTVLSNWHFLFERDDHGAWPAVNKGAKEAKREAQSTGFNTTDAPEDDQEPIEEMASLDDLVPDAQDQDQQEQREQMQSSGQEEDASQSGEDDGQGAISDDEATDVASPSDPADDPSANQLEQSQPEADDLDQEEAERVDESERLWREISKQMEMDLKTFSRDWGSAAGSLMANMEIANRKTQDYSEFLKRFMVPSEEMKVNLDEFDNIYYTYGLDLYGNLPLIEPLEYMETDRIRDFAIVIDTSESVVGPQVKGFIQKTFDILKSSENYANKVNVHIIQCDAKIQSDTKISDLKDVDAAMRNFVLRGLGGTDFRPAFDYIQELMDNGEFENLQGMVYFTDGYGQFPEHAPDFETAFVFLEEEGREIPRIPPWAIKVVIDGSEIEEL